MQKSFRQIIEELASCGDLYEIADKSFSASDIVRSLGYSVSGSRTAIVNSICITNDVDTSHWRINGQKPADRIEKTCPVCTKLFSFISYEPKTTCSHSCSNTYFRSGKDHPNWKDNPQVSYRKKALDHYGASCSVCGYSVTAALVVHHKDKNRQNNTIENLQVLCCNCHAIEHYNKDK